MRVFFKVILALAVVILILPLTPALAADFPLSSGDDEISDALDYLRDAQDSDGNIGGFAVSAWV